MLGHTPFSESTRRLSRLSPFDLVVDPCELYTRAYPPSIGSLDLSHASLSFDLVVDPHELSYWGISPPAEFAYIVILVGFEPLDQIIVIFFLLVCVQFELRPHLYQSIIVLSVYVFGAAPISIDHLPCHLEF